MGVSNKGDVCPWSVWVLAGCLVSVGGCRELFVCNIFFTGAYLAEGPPPQQIH